MTKSELRVLYKEKRKMLGRAVQVGYDKLILDGLKQMDWTEVQYIHLYIPIKNLYEPDTLPFVEWIKRVHGGIKFVVSKSDFEEGKMINYLWDEHTVFETNQWGILEPQGGVQVEEKMFDVVFVPLLVVDKLGNRVGYGKGFYDRFLTKCRSDVQSIGLSYFEPVEQIEDVDSWDVKLKSCVSPFRIYGF